MKPSQRNSRGQVVLLVTLSLIMMLGMLGLAVDLGFSFFVKKSAQAAADAAALAAVSEAYARVGEDGPFICGVKLDCSPASCPGVPAGSNFENGCLYAQRNGFAGGGRQTVRLEGGAWVGGEPVSPPTAPGVHVYYWVTARVIETVPQLFSAVMGNTAATSAARATAAIVDAVIDPSLNLLNRQNDLTVAQGGPKPGVDLAVAGGVTVNGGKGIVLASTAHGPSEFAGDADTGHSSGSATVIAPFTYIRGAGTVNPEVNWLSTEPGVPGWQNGYRERGYFQDPMRGRGQPPPPNLSGPQYDCGLTDGSVIEGPVTLGPGNYYTYKIEPSTGVRVATGKPIRFRGEGVRFGSGGACFAGTTNDNGFGEYVFFGGMHFSFTHTTAIFDPGRYVLAGALQSTGSVFSFTNQVTLKDNTTIASGLAQPNKEGNAGEIFILTDAAYPGLYVPSVVQLIASQLKFGSADLQTGSDSSTLIDLHGLNNDRNNSGYQNVPAELDLFRPVAIWQDQRNSTVAYTSRGYIECGQPDPSTQDGCTYPNSLDNPKPNPDIGISPGMKLQAGPQTSFYGAIYQPRGAWMDLQGSPGARSPLQLVTGALTVHGGGEVTLQGISNPIKRKVVALVE